MPIYEYRCRECRHVFEHLARRLNESPPRCPECGARKPEKQFSAFSALSSPEAASDGGGCPMAGKCNGGSCPLG